MTLPINPTLSRLNKQIKALGELTPAMETQASICRALAEQLDIGTGSKTGSMSMAIPHIAKQLENSIAILLGKKPEEDPFLAFLFSDDDGNDTTIKKRAPAMAKAVTEDD